MDKEPCQQNFRLKQPLGQCCFERVDSHPIKILTQDRRKGGAEETEQLVKKWATEMRTESKKQDIFLMSH